MTPLATLADRVEAAEGPSRELFEEAFIGIHGKASADRSVADTTAWIAAWGRFQALVDVGAWLDAAMGLVPEGASYSVERGMGGECYATVSVPLSDGWWSDDGTIYAATPALALCAAALRARASASA